MTSKSNSKSARSKAPKTVRSIRKEFGGVVEMIDGDYPAPLYKKFFAPLRGPKDLSSLPDLPAPPEGVIEHTSAEYEPISDGTIVQRADGRLMLAQGNGLFESVDRTVCRMSEDGGVTWSRAKRLRCPIGIGGIVRLQSGALAIYGRKSRRGEAYFFSTSKDDGDTWSTPVRIPVHCDFRPMFHSMIQLGSGRLVLAGYWESPELDCYADDLLPLTAGAWGWWRGARLSREGHRTPEMGICKTYYSDDEGKTWHGCRGGMFGWFNPEGIPDGTGCSTDVYEPTVAETNDGRLLMFARSKRGRLVQCTSLDEGQTWLAMQPTELSSSQAPPMLVGLPVTGDLLCVWNQVSAQEIRRGMPRSRLSSALSCDSGQTWSHFKTIVSCEGMAEVAAVAPQFPIPGVTRGDPGPGQVPDGYMSFDYPNVDVVGDKVFLRYTRQWPIMCGKGKAELTGDGAMRIYPLKWFYE
jgi:sialidase-1